MTNPICKLHLLLILAAIVGLNGCSIDEIEFAEVSGVVTSQGKPLANAKVMFVPAQPRASNGLINSISFGVTDENGKYELVMPDKSRGAVVGMHKVMISKMRDNISQNSKTESASANEDADTRNSSNEDSSETDETKSATGASAAEAVADAAKTKDSVGGVLNSDLVEAAVMTGDPFGSKLQPFREEVYSSYNEETVLVFEVTRQGTDSANFEVGLDPLLQK